MSSDSPFGPAAVARAVHASLDAALIAIPDGDTHAVLIDGTYSKADGPGGRIVFVQKAPKGWTVDAYIGYDKPHGAGGGVDLLKSW